MTFYELTIPQQNKAIEDAGNELLRDILQGMRFEEDLNMKIESAIEKAEKMQTPWFAHEYIMDTCSEDIKNIARTWAAETKYTDEVTRRIPKV